MKKVQIVHLGAHFVLTFILATIYFVVNVGWTGLIGLCFIMFFGWLIDSDHFIGNWKRCQQVWQGLKLGEITIGDPDPKRANYFHNWSGFVFIFIINSALFLFADELLGILSFIAYFIHMFIIDVLDCDNQNFPKNNPLSNSIHSYFYGRSKLFRKICFNKHLLTP